MNTLEVVIYDFIGVCDRLAEQIKKNLQKLKKKLFDFIKKIIESYRKIFKDKKILARPPTVVNTFNNDVKEPLVSLR